MQLHQLTAFKRAAETRSFSRAGEDLYLSQSTVSTHIANLEEYFGQRLFDRMGREVILTPFGERVYEWSERLLSLHGQALDDLTNYTSELRGTLQIAASTVPAQYIVPGLMSAFRERYHAVSFVVKQGSSEEIAERLLRSQVDLGVVGETYYPERLMFVPFHSEKLVLITPPDLKLRDDISVCELRHHPFLFRSEGSGTQANIERVLGQSGTSPRDFNVVAHLDSVQAIKQAVRDGLGISIISEIAARDYMQAETLNIYRLKEFAEERFFYFAWNRARTLAPYVETFVRMGVEKYQLGRK